jgi:hypothetical protein
VSRHQKINANNPHSLQELEVFEREIANVFLRQGLCCVAKYVFRICEAHLEADGWHI